jgi:hypothetical protein
MLARPIRHHGISGKVGHRRTNRSDLLFRQWLGVSYQFIHCVDS